MGTPMLFHIDVEPEVEEHGTATISQDWISGGAENVANWPTSGMFNLSSKLFSNVKFKLNNQEPLTSVDRANILDALYKECTKFTMYPTKQQYTMMVNYVMTAWPYLALEDGKDPGEVMSLWKKRLRTKFHNTRRRREGGSPIVQETRERYCHNRRVKRSSAIKKQVQIIPVAELPAEDPLDEQEVHWIGPEHATAEPLAEEECSRATSKKWPGMLDISSELYDDVTEKLDNQEPLTNSDRAYIVDAIYQKVGNFTLYPTSEQYDSMVNYMMQTWPYLREGHKHPREARADWRKRLRYKFQNMRKRDKANVPIVQETRKKYSRLSKGPSAAASGGSPEQAPENPLAEEECSGSSSPEYS